MKCFKRLFAIILTVVLISSLTGCIIVPDYEYYDKIDIKKVSSIDVHILQNIESRHTSSIVDDTLLYSLKEEQFSDFINDLSEIRFTQHYIIFPAPFDPSFNYGKLVVKITYLNGNYMFISNAGYGQTFNSAGEQIDNNHYSCDDNDWESLIRKYLPD